MIPETALLLHPSIQWVKRLTLLYATFSRHEAVGEDLSHKEAPCIIDVARNIREDAHKYAVFEFMNHFTGLRPYRYIKIIYFSLNEPSGSLRDAVLRLWFFSAMAGTSVRLKMLWHFRRCLQTHSTRIALPAAVTAVTAVVPSSDTQARHEVLIL